MIDERLLTSEALSVASLAQLDALCRQASAQLNVLAYKIAAVGAEVKVARAKPDKLVELAGELLAHAQTYRALDKRYAPLFEALDKALDKDVEPARG